MEYVAGIIDEEVISFFHRQLDNAYLSILHCVVEYWLEARWYVAGWVHQVSEVPLHVLQ